MMRWAAHYQYLVVAPLASLRYNLDAHNLAAHGLHGRWLHVAVNMPLLFGPLALVLYARLLRAGADLVQGQVCGLG